MITFSNYYNKGLDTFVLYGKLINFANETRYGKRNSRNESN